MAKFLLLMNYGPTANCDVPMDQWPHEDIAAHIRFQQDLGKELADNGELVDAQGLAGPELAKTVTHTGVGSPVITDGPFPESKELLAGYWLVDTTLERALEIAAQASAAPGPNGVPIGQPIEVRELMSAPAASDL
ncbi:YciI family protein [Saccharothrix sp. HUAS TT1]|uniref:YciI family protein n=1 Tax=unclassified Saccharothrix TaxID=2593673 RepID=UPI00345BE7A0